MGQRMPDGTPVPFDCSCYTFNRKTKRGGQLMHHQQVVLHTEDSQPNPRSIRARQQAREAKAQAPAAKHRPGAHFRLATRNLQTPAGDLHKIIIWLLTEFNGHRVVL
jgi:hypothetical protein